MTRRLFGTTGIRGLANEFLTPEFCSKLGAVFGNYVGAGKKILVGEDVRTSSGMLKNSVIAGLVSVGCDVYDAGLVPTPAIQYCARNFDFHAGVMVTGSHIPPERNGVKFFIGDGTEVYGEMEEEIEAAFFADNIRRVCWDKIGKIEQFDAHTPYKELLLNHAVHDNLKIVLDPGHGTQCSVLPYVLRELGYQLITINSQVDGRFPGRISEPEEKNVEDLKIIVKELRADVGVALDGDGDKAIFIDDSGNYVMGDVSGGILADFLMNQGDRVITSISTSALIDYIANKRGGRVIRTKVGAANMIALSIKLNACFAFEENGGCIFPAANLAADGGLTTVYMLKILKAHGNLSELVSQYPKYYQLKDKIECPDEFKPQLVAQLKELYSGQEILDVDGIKVIFQDGWILLRPSGTEPVFRIFVEATSQSRAKELMKEGLANAKSILKGLP